MAVVINSGSISSGTVTLNGTGFGVKTTPAPSSWLGGDSGCIESGTPGQDAACTNWGGGAAGGSAIKPKYTTARAYSGTQSIQHNFEGDQYNSEFVHDIGSTATTVYLTGYVYIEKNDDYTQGQWKSFRISDTSAYAVSADVIFDNWFFTGAVWGNNDCQAFYNGGASSAVVGSLPSDAFPFGEWFRFEMITIDSSANDAADGVVIMRRIGHSGDLINSSTVITKTTGDNPWRYVRTGQYYGNLSGGTGPRDANIYWDDHYVDTTQARIELGNASTWAACTQKGIQPPVTWSTTDATATFNQDTFADGATVYAYLVDEDGAVNSDGFELSIPVGTEPVVEAGSNQNVSVNSVAISGTYSLEGARTVASCTYTNSLGGSGSLTAAGGTITGTVPSLSEGSNVITITVTDSSAESGNDSMTATYSIPDSGTTTITAGTPTTIDPTGTPVSVGA